MGAADGVGGAGGSTSSSAGASALRGDHLPPLEEDVLPNTEKEKAAQEAAPNNAKTLAREEKRFSTEADFLAADDDGARWGEAQSQGNNCLASSIAQTFDRLHPSKYNARPVHGRMQEWRGVVHESLMRLLPEEQKSTGTWDHGWFRAKAQECSKLTNQLVCRRTRKSWHGSMSSGPRRRPPSRKPARTGLRAARRAPRSAPGP